MTTIKNNSLWETVQAAQESICGLLRRDMGETLETQSIIWRFKFFSRWRAIGVFVYSLLAFGIQYHIQPDVCSKLLGPFVVIAGMLSGFLQFIYPGKFMYALGAAVLVFMQAYLFLSVLSFFFSSISATTRIVMRLIRR